MVSVRFRQKRGFSFSFKTDPGLDEYKHRVCDTLPVKLQTYSYPTSQNDIASASCLALISITVLLTCWHLHFTHHICKKIRNNIRILHAIKSAHLQICILPEAHVRCFHTLTHSQVGAILPIQNSSLSSLHQNHGLSMYSTTILNTRKLTKTQKRHCRSSSVLSVCNFLQTPTSSNK